MSLRADVAQHAPHGRKHGAAFAHAWTVRDETVIVAVGHVLDGSDPVAVGDLLHSGARALVTSPERLHDALVALDRTLAAHAREHRDERLAAALALLAFAPAGDVLSVAAAGTQLTLAIVDGRGEQRPVHARAAVLGSGLEPHDEVERIPLVRDDLVVAATVLVDAAWWPAGDRTAASLLARSGEREAAAAVIAADAAHNGSGSPT